MSSYEIHRWDAITSNNMVKYPLIYIKPDDTTNVTTNVVCKISGTNMEYDERMINARVSKIASIHSCSPNYSIASHYYTITLIVPWIGYPSSNGSVEIVGYN